MNELQELHLSLKKYLFNRMFMGSTIYLATLKWFQYDYPKSEYFNYGAEIRTGINPEERKIIVKFPDGPDDFIEIEFYLDSICIDDKDTSIKFVLNNYTDLTTHFSFIFTKMTMDFQLESFDNYQEIESALLL